MPYITIIETSILKSLYSSVGVVQRRVSRFAITSRESLRALDAPSLKARRLSCVVLCFVHAKVCFLRRRWGEYSGDEKSKI